VSKAASDSAAGLTSDEAQRRLAASGTIVAGVYTAAIVLAFVLDVVKVAVPAPHGLLTAQSCGRLGLMGVF
jgi:hypothetical protein